MKKLQNYLNNIKKQDFIIIIEENIEEIHFYYNKKDDAIVVSNIRLDISSCHWSAADYYELDETEQIIHLYGEFEHLIK